MIIKELENYTINPGLAYVLGSIIPYFKKGKDNGGKEFIKGCANYNSVSDEDLAAHFKSVLHLMEKNHLNDLIPLSNKQDGYSISPKKGFSILIYKENLSDEECLAILIKKVLEIKETESFEIKKEFMKGVFDGRASWDSTYHFFSIDADRDYERQDLIYEIFKSAGIDLQLNRRAKDYGKNDQIRLRPKDIKDFIQRIGLFNVMKKNQILEWLGEVE